MHAFTAGIEQLGAGRFQLQPRIGMQWEFGGATLAGGAFNGAAVNLRHRQFFSRHLALEVSCMLVHQVTLHWMSRLATMWWLQVGASLQISTPSVEMDPLSGNERVRFGNGEPFRLHIRELIPVIRL